MPNFEPETGASAGWLAWLSRALTMLLIIAMLAVSVLIASPAQAQSSEDLCHDRGGRFVNGRCVLDRGPDAFDLFGQAIIAGFILMAILSSGEDEKSKPPGPHRPQQQR